MEKKDCEILELKNKIKDLSNKYEDNISHFREKLKKDL